MAKIQSVCVYCGSSQVSDPKFNAPTIELGKRIAAAGLTLVYGGGSPGLMGKVANAVMDEGGKVIGVIPDHILKLEVRHDGLSELHVVPSMHVRKQIMAEKSDAFVVLPGGLGTLDETFEILTWRYLGMHSKPIIIVNIDGYWDPLLSLIDHMLASGFMRPEHRETFQVASTVEDVMDLLLHADATEGRVQVDRL
jgi:uncharacterized protein (TIGR00730 family)